MICNQSGKCRLNLKMTTDKVRKSGIPHDTTKLHYFFNTTKFPPQHAHPAYHFTPFLYYFAKKINFITFAIRPYSTKNVNAGV